MRVAGTGLGAGNVRVGGSGLGDEIGRGEGVCIAGSGVLPGDGGIVEHPARHNGTMTVTIQQTAHLECRVFIISASFHGFPATASAIQRSIFLILPDFVSGNCLEVAR